MRAFGLDNKILRLCKIVLRVTASLNCFRQNIIARVFLNGSTQTSVRGYQPTDVQQFYKKLPIFQTLILRSEPACSKL